MSGGLASMLMVAKGKGASDESDNAPLSERLEDARQREDDALDDVFAALHQKDPAMFKRAFKTAADACYLRRDLEDEADDSDDSKEDY